MAGFRKRVYAGPSGGRMAKRSRVFKRRTRRFKRGRRSVTYTSKASAARSFGFRSKKISKRSWNSKLWNSTLQKAHYRSHTAYTTTLTVNATPTIGNINRLNAMTNGNAWWLSTGGAIDVDGGTMPFVTDDIILRGGKLTLTLGDDPTANLGAVRYRVWLIKTADNPVFTDIPSSDFISWDPSLVPEFVPRIGRILRSFQGDLEDGNAVTFEHRVPIEKIDINTWNREGRRLQWIIQTHSLVPLAGAAGIEAIQAFNLSFSADVIGTA